MLRICLSIALLSSFLVNVLGQDLQRLGYNNPELSVDLGGGLYAWPLPMDYDNDGDFDLLVSSPDAVQNSLLFFENPGGDSKLPIFKPPVQISTTVPNLQVSYVDGVPRVLGPNVEYQNFQQNLLRNPVSFSLSKNIHPNPVRANQWKYVDFDNDGTMDLVIGIEDWTEYGWDDAFDASGKWTRGPLRGYVYLARNEGSDERPRYAEPVKLIAEDGVIDVYGMPSPIFADFDGDGDLDLLCGEFVDKLKYFENKGTRSEPRYAEGRFLPLGDELLKIDCCMFVPVAIDWDHDGDLDLIIGQEDGRVMFCEHTGEFRDGLPLFAAPRFFQQQAAELKQGILPTPTACDWDGDGDQDLIAGDGSGRVGFIENLGGNPPRWREVQYLQAGGDTIRIQAGPNGSIQGPCESKWGYTVPCVADWDGDGRLDLMLNSIWGKVVWYRNIGTRKAPKLASARPVQIAWEGTPPYPAWNWWKPEKNEFASQWRSSLAALDINNDGHLDLVAVDHEGFLACYFRDPERDGLTFTSGRRIFRSADEQKSAFDQTHNPVFADADNDGRNDFVFPLANGNLPYSHTAHIAGRRLLSTKTHPSIPQENNTAASRHPPLRLSAGWAGRSGRRKFCFTDWDGDGRLDLLVNSINVNFLRNVAQQPGDFLFEDRGPVAQLKLAGHTTCPTMWQSDNGQECLLIGAEDGYFYLLGNSSGDER